MNISNVDINNIKMSDLDLFSKNNIDTDNINLFQHNGYFDNLTNKKTLLFDSGSISLPSTTTSFKQTLTDKLIIDKKSDIYLDSLTTFNSKSNTDTNTMGFLVKFNDFSQSNNISNDSTISNKLFIPNKSTSSSLSVVHKGKKLNYICTVNPGIFTTLDVTFTDLNNANPFSSSGNGRFILELLIIDSQ